MSYYDFDDHFWSPKVVCIQSKSVDSEKNAIRIKLTNILFIIFVTVWAGLLIKVLLSVSISQNNQIRLNTDSFSSNCLMFNSNSIRKIYCPQVPDDKN